MACRLSELHRPSYFALLLCTWLRFPSMSKSGILSDRTEGRGSGEKEITFYPRARERQIPAFFPQQTIEHQLRSFLSIMLSLFHLRLRKQVPVKADLPLLCCVLLSNGIRDSLKTKRRMLESFIKSKFHPPIEVTQGRNKRLSFLFLRFFCSNVWRLPRILNSEEKSLMHHLPETFSPFSCRLAGWVHLSVQE
ncbi:hypothetical protein CCACVL1_03143 [Corchorus capsularis]|uniref:Uncharacterized protein n=1 Tax=Corchorus capsularis TaxID=210143 RepID=A0A1R3K298_COCAP|nr:hypothetical protein CCACVL1_03143 [Corchorus capsularis]